MNPNLFVGKLFDGNHIGSVQRHQDTKFRKIVQDNIFNKDVEEFKKLANHQYVKPNQPVTLVKPVERVYLSKSEFVSGELKHLVNDLVDDKLDPTIRKDKSIFPRLHYLEREIGKIHHDIIQFRKTLHPEKVDVE